MQTYESLTTASLIELQTDAHVMQPPQITETFFEIFFVQESLNHVKTREEKVYNFDPLWLKNIYFLLHV